MALSVVIVNYAYDPRFATPERTLAGLVALPEFASGLRAAGVEVRVVQRYQRDATLCHAGVSYEFVADGGRARPRTVDACLPVARLARRAAALGPGAGEGPAHAAGGLRATARGAASGAPDDGLRRGRPAAAGGGAPGGQRPPAGARDVPRLPHAGGASRLLPRGAAAGRDLAPRGGPGGGAGGRRLGRAERGEPRGAPGRRRRELERDRAAGGTRAPWQPPCWRCCTTRRGAPASGERRVSGRWPTTPTPPRGASRGCTGGCWPKAPRRAPRRGRQRRGQERGGCLRAWFPNRDVRNPWVQRFVTLGLRDGDGLPAARRSEAEPRQRARRYGPGPRIARFNGAVVTSPAGSSRIRWAGSSRYVALHRRA